MPTATGRLRTQAADRAIRQGRAVPWAASILALGLLAVLVACGASANSSALLVTASLSSNTLHIDTRRPTIPLELRYTLSRPAQVLVFVRPASGRWTVAPPLPEPVTLGMGLTDRAAGSYYLRVDGSVPLRGVTPGPQPAAVSWGLPNGNYQLVVQAKPTTDTAQAEEWTGAFTVQGAPESAPLLENVQAHPDIISPNSDAVDDVAGITFRTAQTSTTSVTVFGPTGQRVPVLAPTPLPAGEHNYAFSGMDLLGQVLPDGLYTATVRTADAGGNAVEARVPITLTGGGTPSIAVLSADFSPHALMYGNTLTVRVKVQNTGKVPLRTQGPDSGYTYTTNDTYSSIAGGQYVDKAGLWRVGVDWDGNAGGGPLRYPFRWGFGHTLAPGETVTIEGHVTILKYERQMWFFTGILQEGVRIVLDRLAPTVIDVGF